LSVSGLERPGPGNDVSIRGEKPHTMTVLAERQCVPCRGGVPPLTDDELAPLLAQIDPAWTVESGRDGKARDFRYLARTYRFDDFKAALAYAVRVGAMAEEQAHHPDLHVAWGRVRVEIWTHKIAGLTESDVIFAAKCDALACAPAQ
jgi:4a-hydroxytetrahydrobiopterin dehydratase